MPNKDGTGPKGKGAMTGSGSGKCIIPLNTKQEELTVLNNQKKVLRAHLQQIETKIATLEKPNQTKD